MKLILSILTIFLVLPLILYFPVITQQRYFSILSPISNKIVPAVFAVGCSMSPNVVRPLQRINVSGRDLSPNTSYDLRYSTRLMPRIATTDGSGNFRTTITIPINTATGRYAVFLSPTFSTTRPVSCGPMTLEVLEPCPDLDGDGVADCQPPVSGGIGVTRPTGSCDTNNDGVVDVIDEQEVASRQGVRQGDPNYVVRADVNRDGVIDRSDIDACVAQHGPPGGTPTPPPGGVPVGGTTEIGAIPTSATGFIQAFLRWGIGVVGGLAFLLLLFGAFRVLTSGGSPEVLNEGREIIVSAIAGLVFVIFSVVLLKIIGVDILRLPGFSTGGIF